MNEKLSLLNFWTWITFCNSHNVHESNIRYILNKNSMYVKSMNESGLKNVQRMDESKLECLGLNEKHCVW